MDSRVRRILESAATECARAMNKELGACRTAEPRQHDAWLWFQNSFLVNVERPERGRHHMTNAIEGMINYARESGLAVFAKSSLRPSVTEACIVTVGGVTVRASVRQDPTGPVVTLDALGCNPLLVDQGA